MKTKYLITIALILSVSSGIFLSGCATGCDKSALNTDLSSTQNPTITHKLYDIPKGKYTFFSDKVKLEHVLSRVSSAIDPSINYAQCEKSDVLKVLRATEKAIQKELGSYTEHLMDCNNMSLIYLSVGRRFGIPLYGVSAPGHFFIRYDPDGKHDSINRENEVNRNDFNWEGTEGVIITDREYISEKNISSCSIAAGTYLRNLSDSELPGDIYSEMGIQAFKTKDWDEAIALFERSLDHNPLDAGAYFNMGSAMFNKRFIVKEPEALESLNLSSIASLSKSIELDPNNISSYYFRGSLYMDSNEDALATEDFESCLNIDSRNQTDRLLQRRARNKLQTKYLQPRK